MSSCCGICNGVPMVGPLTYWVKLPSRNPFSVVRRHRGDLRLLLEASCDLACCRVDGIRSFYDSFPKYGPYSLVAARIAFIASLILGDTRLFDRSLADIRAYPKHVEFPYAQHCAELTEAGCLQRLFIPNGYPEWLLRMDLRALPRCLRAPAGLLAAQALFMHGEYATCYAAATLLLEQDERQDVVSSQGTLLKLTCSNVCFVQRRREEMCEWFTRAIVESAPHGFALPFLGASCGRETNIGRLLSELAPALYEKVKAITPSYHLNRVRLRNHLTGEKATECLSMREFFIGWLLKRRWRSREIADLMGLSAGHINNLIAIIYEKLDIHSRAELGPYVW